MITCSYIQYIILISKVNTYMNIYSYVFYLSCVYPIYNTHRNQL